MDVSCSREEGTKASRRCAGLGRAYDIICVGFRRTDLKEADEFVDEWDVCDELRLTSSRRRLGALDVDADTCRSPGALGFLGRVEFALLLDRTLSSASLLVANLSMYSGDGVL
eukprot:1395564-Amorphochlora_amoeboformis.AAC.2